MRLKHIKLVGFKSFVDLTKVPFPHQMTAVVGPNGCGKSNIIDAVRWVLGESSAKNLRGDAMTDVIFNGASARKPVGQASVELVFSDFDASVGYSSNTNIAASLANRNEISVKRLVDRSGDNKYFLNGARCRKKDITDIFLGSGLGPRSYAIIEQGTISRLIESKPEELKVFIDEAAGVSKYKERRRETSLKINHTKDNLARLLDISSEITRQLDHLSGQAEEAEQYKKLKASERQLNIDIAERKLAKAVQKLAVSEQQIAQYESEILVSSHKLTSFDKTRQSLKQEEHQLTEQLQQVNEKINDAQNKINLLDQEINFIERGRIKEQAGHDASQNQLKEELLREGEHKEKRAQASQTVEKLAPEIAKLQSSIDLETENLNRKQRLQFEQHEHIQKAQLKITEARNKQALLVSQQADKVRLQSQLEERITYIDVKLASQQVTSIEDLQSKAHAINNLNTLIAAEKEQKLELNATRLLLDKEQRSIVSKQATLNAQLHSGQSAHQTLLEQQQTTEPWQQKQCDWLNEHQIDYKNEFASYLDVSSKWQKAIFQLLGNLLHAHVLKDFTCLSHNHSSLKPASLFLINASALTLVIQDNTVASALNSQIGVMPWLNNIELAETLDDAYLILDKIQASHCEDGGIKTNDIFDKYTNKSVLCIDGTWLQIGSIDRGSEVIEVNPLVIRERLKETQSNITEIEHSLSQANSEYGRSVADISTLGTQITGNEKSLAAHMLEVQTLEKQYALDQQHQSLLTEQAEDYRQEKVKVEQDIVQCQSSLREINSELQSIVLDDSEQDKIKKQQANYQQLTSDISLLQQSLQVNKQTLQQQSIALEQAKLSLTNINSHLLFSQERLVTIREKLTQHITDIAQLGNVSALELTREEHQLRLSSFKLSAKEYRDGLSTLANTKQEVTKQYQMLTELKQSLTEKVHAQALLKEQLTFEVNAIQTSISDMTTQINIALEDVHNHDAVSLAELERRLKTNQAKLNQLGVVNLAAINEYQLQDTRKKQIDLQIDDLTNAISTLESAIQKIDKETRSKFKSTFDQVNQGLQSLFPKVFGGGKAYLQLTSEDLLDTGVTIMARPPGKKNSTIHLLSGGEKALTALSLVFAIFRLNPAPFCMLDEVDAPLDDANVGRFCNLVKEMSQSVQFIYISHNKIAMEMASHLTGVTMFEPGVSKMVSVDIDEAIAMAEVS